MIPLLLHRNLLCSRPLPVFLLAAALTASGCRKPEIRSYIAPKDQEVAPRRSPDSESAPPSEMPKVTWSLPAAWKEAGADQMNVGRFSAPGEVSIMVTPLALMSGQEASLVNMWRQATEQPLLSAEDATKALSEVEIAGTKGSLFEVAGKRGGADMKVITAFLHRDTRSWFFKLQGNPAAVDVQKPAFLEFLKSIKFEAGAASSNTGPSPAPAPAAGSASVPGTPPESWTSQTPGAMQAAKFAVSGKDGAKAEVTVSIFPSDTGGVPSNVSRWRGQLGLPAADEATLKESIKPLPGAPEGSVMVDLENNGRSLTGAIVPRGGKWFFYKLMGESAAVAAARDAFIAYCKAGS
ncbi:MAG TPA: hypothetical protein VG796_17410 [Verrucomicrobiales bacterium]|nr:hypothetical protein [Verrucomicrobiales bacterium]